MSTKYWKARDAHDIVHVIEQHTFEDRGADCSLYCDMYVDEPLFYEDTFPPVPRATEITCLRCLAEIEPALLRILG